MSFAVPMLERIPVDKEFNGPDLSNVEYNKRGLYIIPNCYILYNYHIVPDNYVVVEGDIVLSKEQADKYYSQRGDGLVNSQGWLRKKHTTRWDHQILFEVSSEISKICDIA